MKTATAALQQHITQEVTTLASCCKIILTKYQPRITAITKANPGVVTTLWAHGYATGDTVKIVKCNGMTQVNDNEYQIIKVNDFSFSIGVNTTGFSTFTKHGEARKVIGYSNSVHDITFDNVVYKATLAYVPKSVKQGSDMSVDTAEIIGIQQNAELQVIQKLEIDGVSDEDLTAGRYDNAEVEFFVVNYEDLSQGLIYLPGSGRIGAVSLHRGTYEAELRSKTSFLQENIGEKYSAVCRAELGDYEQDPRMPAFGCKVPLDPLKWAATTAYTVRPAGDSALGSTVKPTIYNGRHFVCTVAGTSGGSEPAWNLVIGGSTVDGGVTWRTIDALTKFGVVDIAIDRKRFTDLTRKELPSDGLASTGALYPIVAINPIPHTFEVAGHIADQFPTNSVMTVVNSTANDGDYVVETSAISGANTRITVPDNSIPSLTADGQVVGRLAGVSGFFTHGKLTFLTGENKGIAREVKNFSISSYPIVDLDQGTPSFSIDGDQTAYFAADDLFQVTGSTGNDITYTIVSSTYDIGSDTTILETVEAIPDATVDGNILGAPGAFELFESFPFDIVSGDTYEVTAGCDLSRLICKGRFDNIHNRRAEDFIPGMDSVLLYPDAK